MKISLKNDVMMKSKPVLVAFLQIWSDLEGFDVDMSRGGFQSARVHILLQRRKSVFKL